MLKALITVILLQLAMTFKGAIVALANLDTREMDFLAQVSTCVFLYYFSNYVCTCLLLATSSPTQISFENCMH